MKNAKLFWRILGYVLIPALFFCFGSNGLLAQDKWEKVSSASDLTAGDEVIIVAGTSAFDGEIASKWGKFVAVTTSGNNITTTVATSKTDYTKPHAFVVEFSGENLSLRGKLDEGYLQGTSGDNNISYATTAITVTLTTEGIHDVSANANLRLNGASGFRFYKNNGTTGTATALYKKQAPSTDPFVSTSDNEVSYKLQPSETLNKTLSFTAGNLTGDLTVSVASATDGQNAVVAVNPTTISKDQTSFNLTLTTSTLAEGTYSDIITIKSGETTMATVKVNLTVEQTYPYKKITTTEELTEGTYLIVCDTKNKAAGSMQSGKTFLDAVDVTIVSGEIGDKGTAEEFLLEKNGSNWNIKNVGNSQYLKTTAAKAAAYASTAFPWTITFSSDELTIASSGSGHGNLYYNASSPRFLNYTGGQTAVQLYKKQIPVCNAVTVPADGGVTPRQDDVTIVWNAPDPAPANGYRVTVKGEGYEKSETVTDGTQIVWVSELTPATRYEYSIVSLCGENLESDPVGATFTTLSADQPSLTITAPDNDAVFSGDVEFAFTTTNFELGDSKLVKVEVKTDIENPSTAPAIRTLYTKASPVVIDGLEDGKYHIDLYLANVTPKTEGEGNDTTVVNLGHYVHRNIEVKRPAVYFAQKTLQLTGTYQGTAVEGKMKVIGWALPASPDKVTVSCPTGNFSVTPAELTRDEVMAEGGAEITVTYNGAQTSESAEITLTYGAMTDKLTVTATTTEVREVATLAGLYSGEKGVHYRVKGKMVVTHKDDYNNRIWVQDIEKENGASMLLYKAADGYADIKVGDVLESVVGKLDVYNQLYELLPVEKLLAVESGHAIRVDTLTADYINKNIATVQSALVCVENVSFTAGTFAKTNAAARKLTLNQGSVKLEFYTTFDNADYVGESTPAGILNVTGILGNNNGTAQITARNKADMVEAPCVEPTELSSVARAYSATIRWSSNAAADSVRYGTDAALSDATQVKVSGGEKAYTIESGLTPETKYYFQVKSLCSETQESEWSEAQEFTTVSATVPTIQMNAPTSNQTFTDSVTVEVYVRNIQTLSIEDTCIRITFSNGTTVKTADTLTKYALLSGDYTVKAELVKGETALEGVAPTSDRRFSVNLPDVEAPVFAPAEGRYEDSVEVTLACSTDGATIFYAKGDAEFAAYTEGSKIVLKENATLKAFACKERMDTSATVTATYTITESIAIEGDLVLFEDFSKSKTASTTAITDFDKVTDVSGWSGENMYPEVNEIKGGTSSKAGKLVSPALNLSHDNGKYYVVFTARAFDNAKDATTIRLIAGEDTVSVEGLDKKMMSEYVYMFTNGTADMKITFEAVNESNNRFYIDSVRVYQVLPQVPTIMAPASMTMATFQGVSVSKEVAVKGKLLDADVTVACPAGNFTVTPATLAKADVMGEGAAVTVTFNGEKALDTVEITFTSGDLTETMTVYASAEEMTTVASLSELRKGTQGKLYKVSGKVVLTAMDNNYRNYKWIQDEHAGIMIDDATALVKNTYAVGDGIEGVYGRLGNYRGQLQLAMVGNLPEASSHNNAITPVEVSAADLKAGIDTLCSRVVKLTGLELDSTDGVWQWNGTYKALQGEADVNIRTILENADFLGEALPQGEFDLVGLAAVENNTVRVAPRSKEDIIAGNIGNDTTANGRSEELACRLYPNPTGGVFYVEVGERATVDVFNVSGVRVYADELAAGKHELQLNTSGIYVVRLRNANGVAVKRVIVR